MESPFRFCSSMRLWIKILGLVSRWRCGVYKPGCSEYHRLSSVKETTPSAISSHLIEMAMYVKASAFRVTRICGTMNTRLCSLKRLDDAQARCRAARQASIVQKG
jgi:hypothetical protein